MTTTTPISIALEHLNDIAANSQSQWQADVAKKAIAALSQVAGEPVEPVAWVEGDQTAKTVGVAHVLKYQMLYSMRWHCGAAKPATSNPVWPLYASPQPADQQSSDENAPWLTLAHSICSDAGIEHGHISDRLKALQDKLYSAPEAAELAHSLQQKTIDNFDRDESITKTWPAWKRDYKLTKGQNDDSPAYGIIDPDYAKAYTIIRKLAWEEGYAIGMHGSFTRDLDLIAVPWSDRVSEPEHLVRRICASVLNLTDLHSNPGIKPHGRKVWTLTLPDFGDPRFIDLSICTFQPQQAPKPSQVPEGWRIVPIEPTKDMIDDAIRLGDVAIWDKYAAMIAAAPSVPVQSNGEEG